MQVPCSVSGAEALCQELQLLEVSLHRPAVRRDVARLSELLHTDFLEFGRSGRRYGKADILAHLPSQTDESTVHASEFVMRPLGPQTAMLTYRSAHLAEDGRLHRHTLRSSIWQHTPSGWQMLFHQGTPTES